MTDSDTSLRSVYIWVCEGTWRASVDAALSLAPAGTRLVQLNWNAPNSPSDTIVGYNVYRAMNGATYELLNGTLNASTSYTDGAVQSGSAYNYYVESIDAAGDSSGPSNLTSVAVP